MQAQIGGAPAPASVDAGGYTGTGSNLSVLSPGSTLARSLAARAGEVVDVLDYGAKCDGATDDTTALQAAFTAGAGKTIQFPAGTCLFTSLTLKGTGTLVQGRGRDASWLRSTSAAGDSITVGDDGHGTSVATYNYVFRDLTIFPNINKTSGFNVHLKNVLSVYFNSVSMGSDLTYAYIGNYIWGGIWADYAGGVHLEQMEVFAKQYGFKLNGSVDSAIHFTNLRRAQTNLYMAGGVSGFHCTQSGMVEGANNMVVDNSVDTTTPNHVNFFGTSCAFDTSSSDNVVINTPLGGLNAWFFTGASIATENGDAIKVVSAPNDSRLLFDNTAIGSYSGTGIGHGIHLLDSSVSVQATGSTVICCNTGYGVYADYASPASAPVYIDASVIWSVSSRGNNLGNTNFPLSYVKSGAPGNATLIGNSTEGDSVHVVGCGGPCASQIELKGGVSGGGPQITAVGGGPLTLATDGSAVKVNNSLYVGNLSPTKPVCSDASKLLATTCGNTQAVSGVAAIVWTGLSGYDTYLVDCTGIQPSSDGASWQLLVGYGTTPTFITSYQFNWMMQSTAPATTNSGGNGDPQADLSAQVGLTNNTAYAAAGRIWVTNAQSSTSYKHIRAETEWAGATGVIYQGTLTYHVANTAPITAVKIQMSTGNISGSCTLRGGAS